MIQGKLANNIQKIFKQKNEELLEKMRQAKDEDEKLKYYDRHLAQKYIDEAPKSTLKLKLSDAFKSVCKNWKDPEDDAAVHVEKKGG